MLTLSPSNLNADRRRSACRVLHRVLLPAVILAMVGCQSLTPAPPVNSSPGHAGLSSGESVVARIRSGLVLDITLLVAGEREVEEHGVRISENGTLTLPLLGALKVVGLTLDELGADLKARYARFYIDPHLIVDFSTNPVHNDRSPWGYVTVLGRVKNPGRIGIPATLDLNVSGAIQQAGGFNTSARSDIIQVTRILDAGNSVTRTVNLRGVGQGTAIGDDIMLQPGDVIFVPESRF